MAQTASNYVKETVDRELTTNLVKMLGFNPKDVKQVHIDPTEVGVELIACDCDGRPFVIGDDVYTFFVSQQIR